MDDDLRERLQAVERAITDDDTDLAALADAAATADRVQGLESRLEELAEDVAELQAATQALRGYVGNVRSVNQAVEERADLALAKASGDGRAGAGHSQADQASHPQDPATHGHGDASTGAPTGQSHAETAPATCPTCGREDRRRETRRSASADTANGQSPSASGQGVHHPDERGGDARRQNGATRDACGGGTPAEQRRPDRRRQWDDGRAEPGLLERLRGLW